MGAIFNYCPVCQGEMKLVKDEAGTPVQSNMPVHPNDKPPKAAMVIGGPVVPVIFRVCVRCGYIAFYHATSLG